MKCMSTWKHSTTSAMSVKISICAQMNQTHPSFQLLSAGTKLETNPNWSLRHTYWTKSFLSALELKTPNQLTANYFPTSNPSHTEKQIRYYWWTTHLYHYRVSLSGIFYGGAGRPPLRLPLPRFLWRGGPLNWGKCGGPPWVPMGGPGGPPILTMGGQGGLSLKIDF